MAGNTLVDSQLDNEIARTRGKTAVPASDACTNTLAQTVKRENAEATAFAPSIDAGAGMLLCRTSDPIASPVAAYFGGDSKLALASQSVLLKQMAENQADSRQEQAAQDMLELLATDVLVGVAVAAVTGAAQETGPSGSAIERADNIATYADLRRDCDSAPG